MLISEHWALLLDIYAEQVSLEEGGTLEQLFTQAAVNLLSDTGETENARTSNLFALDCDSKSTTHGTPLFLCFTSAVQEA